MSSSMYQEEQRFQQLWIRLIVWASLLITWGGAVWLIVKQVRYTQSLGHPPMPSVALALMVVILLLSGLIVPALFWVLRLYVRVEPDGVHIRFWPLPERVIAYSRIVRCYPRTYHPIGEYGGWGIRYGWSAGRAYNVSGNRGVQLELTDGKRVLIGSQRAEELAAAIGSHLANAG